MSTFTLTKWYLDCVDDDGRLTIIYWARLGWEQVALTSTTILSAAAEGVAVTTAVAQVPAPRFADGVLFFQAPDLVFKLHSRTPSFARTLLRTAEGAIDWSCSVPSGQATVQRNGRVQCGLGYAETLQMSIPPWKLPIDELRWGRFTSDTSSLVWINWRGPEPLTLLLQDGCQVSDVDVSDARIRAGDLSLDLSEERVIRDSKLGATLQEIPGARRILPEWLLQASEKKWCNRSAVKCRSEIAARGWTVHERVRFR